MLSSTEPTRERPANEELMSVDPGHFTPYDLLLLALSSTAVSVATLRFYIRNSR